MKTQNIGIAVVLAALLTGCASQEQKYERQLLKNTHKAERKIASGKADVLIGTAFIAGGNKKIKEGKKEKEDAVNELQERLK